MSAPGAGTVAVGGFKVAATELTVMPYGQDLHQQLGALSDGAAGNIAEDVAQAVDVDDPPTSDDQVNGENAARRHAVGLLIQNRQHLICDFTLVHVPPRIGGRNDRAPVRQLGRRALGLTLQASRRKLYTRRRRESQHPGSKAGTPQGRKAW